MYAWLITRLNGTCIWHAMGGVHICTRSFLKEPLSLDPSRKYFIRVKYIRQHSGTNDRQSVSVLGPNQVLVFFFRLCRTKMSSVGSNSAACFGPRTKLSKACFSPPDQIRLPKTVLEPFQDRTKLAVTGLPGQKDIYVLNHCG